MPRSRLRMWAGGLAVGELDDLVNDYAGVVVVLSRPGCQACTLTRQRLDRAGVEYQTIDISTRHGLVQQLREAGLMALPVVKDTHGQLAGGYDPSRIRAIISASTPVKSSAPTSALPVVADTRPQVGRSLRLR